MNCAVDWCACEAVNGYFCAVHNVHPRLHPQPLEPEDNDEDGNVLKECPTCDGNGMKTCPACDGMGQNKCERCEGAGSITEEELDRQAKEKYRIASKL